MGATAAADMLGSAVFPDVQSGSYYDAAVGRLYGAGVIKGAGDGKYHPEQFVTRAEIAVMLDRALYGEASAGVSVRRRTAASSSPAAAVAQSSSSVAAPAASSSSSSSSTSVSSVANVGAAGGFKFVSDHTAFPESASNVSFSIQRYGGTAGAVSVRYTTADGTAKAGTRYNQSTGVVSFADGETTKVVALKFINNEVAEPNETFTVTLSDPTGGAVVGTPGAVTVTILDNDGGGGNSTTPVGSASSSAAGGGTTSTAAGGSITFSAWAYAVDESTGTATVTVLRKGTSTAAVTVDYAMTSGTAEPGLQYTNTQGTLSFAAGETAKTFTVPVLDNTSIDGNKSATLRLTNATGGAAIDAPSSVTITFVDNEAISSGTGSIAFSTDAFSVAETGGSALITVLRRGSYTGSATVNYATNDSTATAGSDYVSTAGILTFAPNESSKSFTVTITKDTLTESEEKVNLTLRSPSGAQLGTTTDAVLKITE